MATTENSYSMFNPENNEQEITIPPQSLTIKAGPFFHHDANTDIAVIVTNQNNMDVIYLGGHNDKWMRKNKSMIVMTDIIIMGYPPIPFSDKPVLIGAKGEVNGILEKYNSSYLHFIISAMPRGGFSGGVCLFMGASCLGLIVESLISDNRETELGFMSVISIQPILDCLKHYDLIPEIQKRYFVEF